MSDEILARIEAKLDRLEAGQAELKTGQDAIREELGQLRTENAAMMEAITSLGETQQSTNGHVVRISRMLNELGLRRAS